MSDSRKAFEKWADTFNTESDEWQDMEVDKVYEQGWRDSRQALKGEPAMWSLSFNGKPANHFTTYPTRGKAEDYIARCKIGEKEPEKVNIEVVPLYTHPASAEVERLQSRVAAQQSALNSICTCSWGAAEFFDVGKAASWMQKIAYDALDEVPSTEAFILRKQAEAVEYEIISLCGDLRKSGCRGISVKELLHESVSRSSRIRNEAKKFDDQ